MSKGDRDRADARFDKAARVAGQEPKPARHDRDAGSKAVLDNMARLKALRLAREATEPPPPVAAKKLPRETSTVRTKSRRSHGRVAGRAAKRWPPDLRQRSLKGDKPSASRTFRMRPCGGR